MVSSTCSSASIESAPAGFPGLTADGVVDAVTDAKGALALMLRPSSVEVGANHDESFYGMELQLKDALPLLSSSNAELIPYQKRMRNKKSSSPKLSSISRRGRYDASFRLAPDYYPLKRWRPVRSRKNSANFSAADLRQLSENLKQYQRENKRKSIIRFFDC